MRALLLGLIIAIAIAVAPRIARAQAPGVKNNATLRITNGTNNAATNGGFAATNATFVAAINPSAQLLALFQTAGTGLAALQNLAAQQGTTLVVLAPGGVSNLTVRANTSARVSVVEINSNNGAVIPPSANYMSVGFTIPEGQSRTLNITQNGAGTQLQFAYVAIVVLSPRSNPPVILGPR